MMMRGHAVHPTGSVLPCEALRLHSTKSRPRDLTAGELQADSSGSRLPLDLKPPVLPSPQTILSRLRGFVHFDSLSFIQFSSSFHVFTNSHPPVDKQSLQMASSKGLAGIGIGFNPSCSMSPRTVCGAQLREHPRSFPNLSMFVSMLTQRR